MLLCAESKNIKEEKRQFVRDNNLSLFQILVFLAVFDNVFILCAVLEAIRKYFGALGDLHVYLYAYFLYQVSGRT